MKNKNLKKRLGFYGIVNIISCLLLLISALIIIVKINSQNEITDNSNSIPVYKSYFETLQKIEVSHESNIPDILKDYKSFPFLWKNSPDVRNSAKYDVIDGIIQNINTDIQVLRRDSLYSQRLNILVDKYKSIMPYVLDDVFKDESVKLKNRNSSGYSVSLLMLFVAGIVISVISLLIMKHNSDSITGPVYELMDNLEKINNSESIDEKRIALDNGYELEYIADQINNLLEILNSDLKRGMDELAGQINEDDTKLHELQIDYEKLNEYQDFNEKLKQMINDLRNIGTKLNLEFSGNELADRFSEIKVSFIDYHDFMKQEYNKAVDKTKNVMSFMKTIMSDLNDSGISNTNMQEGDISLLDISPILSDIGTETERIRKLASELTDIQTNVSTFVKVQNRISDFAEQLLMIAINLSISGNTQGDSAQIRKVSEDLKKISGLMNEISIQSESASKDLIAKSENVGKTVLSSEKLISENLKALDDLNSDMKSKSRIITDMMIKNNASRNEINQITEHIGIFVENNVQSSVSEKIKERFGLVNSLINDVPVDEGNLNELTSEMQNKIAGVQNISTKANNLMIDILNEYSNAVKELNLKINLINDIYKKLHKK